MRISTRILIKAFLLLPVLLYSQRAMFLGGNKPSAPAPKASFGFDYRATAGAGDPAGWQLATSSTSYPVSYTFGSYTANHGWVTSGSTAGCASPQSGFSGIGGYDGGGSILRLIGAVYALPSTCMVWHSQLPAAGSYDIHMAVGWDLTGYTVTVKIYDGSTLLFTLPPSSPSPSTWTDANGTTTADTVWDGTAPPYGGVAKTLTFAGTDLYIAFGSTAVADYAPVASIHILQK